MGWISGWIYRKKKTLTSTQSLTDYIFEIKVNNIVGTDTSTTIYSNAKAKSNLDDIRFTSSDGTTVLNYYQDYISPTSYNFNVKIPSISVGVNTIYIYYGNASATSLSDIDAIYDVIAQHPGGTYDGASQYDTLSNVIINPNKIIVKCDINIHTIPPNYCNNFLALGDVWVSGCPYSTNPLPITFWFYWFGANSSGLNNKIQVYGFSANSELSAFSTTLSLNTNYHINWEYDSILGGQLYINGSAVGGRVGSGVLLTSNTTLNIGRVMKTISCGRGHDWTDGSVTNIVIYNAPTPPTNPPFMGSGGLEEGKIYVKLNGNDAYSGVSWTLAVQNLYVGINLGNFIVIGFGDYSGQTPITLNKNMELLCETADTGGGTGTVILPPTT